MAPIPGNDQSDDPPVHQEGRKSWNTATIVVGAVFLFLLVAFIGTTIAFCIHKRKLRNKLPPEHRPRSYHPFRTGSTDKSSLLADDPSPNDERRSSMFSRERSSVSLYLDAEQPVTKRVSSQSMETVNLIPLQVTPAERQHYMAGHISNGSGVSALSSTYSRDSLGLSPIQPDDGDLGTRPGRPRSTSTSSVRYYGRTNSTSPDNIAAPQLLPVPKIIRTESD
ncbi:hypothetical protein BU23DRAFT_146389 [Bimuria novae-zelandiae CBS 107.79]|uniref:Uncharacterized protein n=1 Tax=Bimuria novae-zelandiae CBS 107.79 TaxID=1447943 RepID=A0A6A5V671_9PLEO|nr:hypothetical protein BU23DRAFT_146389 [Bimuria novae-zelandiae CBS 107.79]